MIILGRAAHGLEANAVYIWNNAARIDRQTKEFCVIKRILIACCIAVSHTAPVLAQSFSLELNGGKVLAEVDKAEFAPSAGELRAAFYLQPQVALEVYAGAGAGSATDLDLDYKVNYFAGGALRLESPLRNDTQAFFLLGYGVSDINLNRSGTGQPGDETFDGPTYGGGLEISPFRNKHLRLNVTVRRYYGDNGIDLDYGSVGFRVLFD